MFKSLEEYYEYVETDSSLLLDDNIAKSLASLCINLHEEPIKAYCSYELLFTDYQIVDGQIVPKYSYRSIEPYPNFDLFDDNLQYIKTRAEKVQNPKYKAKYNHILWESKYKHMKYATLSIDNYFLFLQTFSGPINDNLAQHTFENYVKNLVLFCQKCNYKRDESLQFIISFLGKGILNEYKECGLMQFILEEGKKVEIGIFKSFFEYTTQRSEGPIEEDLSSEYLQLLIHLSPKLQMPVKDYHNRLAKLLTSQAESRKDNFISHAFFLKALSHYQKAGNKQKIEEVTLSLQNAKKNIDFKSIKVEHSDELIQEWAHKMKNQIDELTEKLSSNEIYEYIVLSENIFPKAAVLNEVVRPIMFDLVNVMNFDINKNVTNKQQSGINPYFIHLQNFSIRQLSTIFFNGILNGKISYTSLMEYLKSQSWYGGDFTHTNSNGEIVGFNWIELLSPSLSFFFSQSEIDIRSGQNNSHGYILPIDSLVIKFEGLLREFSRIIGAQTIEIKENGTSERISFEKLLENVKIREIIPENDIALLKFLFTSEGMNLRNNIAHCFYQTNDYSPGIMFLLIAALLRLGNYRFKHADN